MLEGRGAGVRVDLGEVVGAKSDGAVVVDALEDDPAVGRVNLGDLPALAVVDGLTAGVDAGDHLIAGGEGPAADLDLGDAQASSRFHLRPRQRVQLLDLGVSLRDHHRVGALLVGLVPVADHDLAAGLGTLGDDHPLLGSVEADRPSPSPSRIALAPSRSTSKRWRITSSRVIGLRARQSRGRGRRPRSPKLLVVADQDQLRAGFVGMVD